MPGFFELARFFSTKNQHRSGMCTPNGPGSLAKLAELQFANMDLPKTIIFPCNHLEKIHGVHHNSTRLGAALNSSHVTTSRNIPLPWWFQREEIFWVDLQRKMAIQSPTCLEFDFQTESTSFCYELSTETLKI